MEDTICAIATSLGVGAISIIRLSGKDAIEKVNSIFSRDLTNVNSHSVTYGHIVYKNEIIDDAAINSAVNFLVPFNIKSPLLYNNSILENNIYNFYIFKSVNLLQQIPKLLI